MSDSNIKDIRKQVRNVVREILPELLISELVKAVESKLRAEMTRSLDAIVDNQKNLMTYVIRQTSIPSKKE